MLPPGGNIVCIQPAEAEKHFMSFSLTLGRFYFKKRKWEVIETGAVDWSLIILQDSDWFSHTRVINSNV